MKPLTPIADSFKDVFDLCSSTYTKSDLRERLTKISEHTENMDSLYRQYAMTNSLYSFPKETLSNMGVDDIEFESIYNDKLVSKKAIGRDIYMRIKNLCVDQYENRCPSCAKRPVTTLDHFLPKAVFRQLSISPLNLIPNCHDCNKIKFQYVATNNYNELIHPYFDNIDSEQWLFARLVNSDYPVIEYIITKPDSWSECLFERVKNHFHIYELESLYASNAMTLLNSHRHAFQELRKNTNGTDELNSHIQLLYTSFKTSNLNSWDTALFFAISGNDEFYNGEFCSSV